MARVQGMAAASAVNLKRINGSSQAHAAFPSSPSPVKASPSAPTRAVPAPPMPASPLRASVGPSAIAPAASSPSVSVKNSPKPKHSSLKGARKSSKGLVVFFNFPDFSHIFEKLQCD